MIKKYIIYKKINMETHNFFIYQWNIDDKEKEVTSIRVYGLDEQNNNVCLRIENFTPFIYIELPESIQWNESKAQLLCTKLDNLLGNQKPLIKQLAFRKKLYGAHLNSSGKSKLFPYLFCAFSTKDDITQLGYKLRRSIQVSGLGILKLQMHEQSADPILQLTCSKNIPSAGWITFSGKKVSDEEKITLCHSEFFVKYKNLSRLERDTVALPKIMGFDIEVNSTNPSAMPKAEKLGDKVFQISCVIAREGSVEKYTSYLLSLGDPDQEMLGADIIIQRFDTESDLLTGFTELIRTENPNIIVGYNILGFDIPYMIERAKSNMCMFNFDQQGFHKYAHAKEKTIKWSSSAYGTQEFQFLDSEGRLYVDLLPLIKRDYKMDNYKLKTISTFFLGETKDPLSVKGIFKCYRIGIKKDNNGKYNPKARKAMSIVGKYCVQDSVLVVRLMEKLQTWVGLCEMAKTFNVPIFTLYTQGQQIKVYSQVYRYCMYNNITVEQDVYETKEDERYVGAHVFDPIPGVYDRVLPFDFASLYPTTIIAYNIDYSTLVSDEDNVPDKMCHVMEWEDHIGCIAEGSLITVGEYSIKIEKLLNLQENILAYDLDGLEYYKQTNFFDQGYKQCIKLIFEDGTSLECTPDHKIMTSSGVWKEARNLQKNNDRVCCGYSPPEYNITNEILIIDNFVFEGHKLIKFYKLLGVIYSDGYTCKNKLQIFCNHPIDLKNITRDLSSLCENSFLVCTKNYGWYINIIGNLGKCFRNLDGVLLDKKNTQLRTLPTILENASEGELCAFLSGLFGGNDRAFSYSKKSKSFGSISLSWTGSDENLKPVFNKLKKYLNICKINSTINRYRNTTCINIETSELEIFKNKIGFSYCVNKSMRLEACYSYFSLKNKVWEQQKTFIDTIKQYNQKMSTLEAITKTILEYSGPIYNKHYSYFSLSQIKDLLNDKKNWNKPNFSYDDFPTALKYFESIGATNIFLSSYEINIEQLKLPCIYKKLIYVKNIGIKHVYDLEVETSHSFIANGVIVHNCIHDPKIIRKTQLTALIDKEKEKITELRKKRDKTLDKLLKKEFKDKIDKLNLEIKPYMEERSNLTKSKPKFPMCAKRYYRFLKEPKGVLPTILQNLLDARKGTRNEIKKHNKKIKEEQDENIINNLKILNNVLDKRQLSYKVSANSVSATTPILCEINGLFIFKTIEELSKGNWIRINNEQEISLPIDGIKVWSDTGFTNPKFVMRHPRETSLKRIITPTGLVDCTEDHSLLSPLGQEVKPSELKIGDELMHYQYPLPNDTPSIPLYHTLTDQMIKNYVLNGENEENAFIHGLFFAKGKCETKSSWVIYNENYTLLERARYILNKNNLYKNTIFVISSYYNSPKLFYLTLTGNIKEIVKKYRILYYDDRKYKKIPEYILNSSFNIRQAFFMGYYSGDVSKKNKKGIIVNNKGERGTASLMYLMNSLGYKVNISNYKNRSIFTLQCSTNFILKNMTKIKSMKIAPKEKSLQILTKPIIINNKLIKFNCNKNNIGVDYVYDIETENHHFAAGIGHMIVHNSMYGAMGVRKGYLPFMAGAMATTYMGRKSIELVAKVIPEKYGGKLVYGDTDSNYIHFPHLQTAAESWDYAEYVAAEVSKLFPPPMSLAFEEVIYWRFFILTKKRYMYKSCGRDGVVEEKIGKKGVLLARRDNSLFIRKFYEQLIMKIFNKENIHNMYYFILNELNKLCSNSLSYKDFTVTKAVGNTNNMEIQPFNNEKGEKKVKIGDYIVPILSNEPDKREKQFLLKNASEPIEYYTKCLPAQVQLAERMKRRGQRVDIGTRLEYVITENGGCNAKQYEKVESSDYFALHKDILRLDFMYYLKLLTNPADQVLNVAYKNEIGFKKDFVTEQYNYRLKVRTKLLNELKHIFTPKLVFEK